MTEEALYQAKRILPRDKYRSLVMFTALSCVSSGVIASAAGCTDSLILAEVAVNSAKDGLCSCVLARSFTAAMPVFRRPISAS